MNIINNSISERIVPAMLTDKYNENSKGHDRGKFSLNELFFSLRKKKKKRKEKLFIGKLIIQKFSIKKSRVAWFHPISTSITIDVNLPQISQRFPYRECLFLQSLVAQFSLSYPFPQKSVPSSTLSNPRYAIIAISISMPPGNRPFCYVGLHLRFSDKIFVFFCQF